MHLLSRHDNHLTFLELIVTKMTNCYPLKNKLENYLNEGIEQYTYITKSGIEDFETWRTDSEILTADYVFQVDIEVYIVKIAILSLG